MATNDEMDGLRVIFETDRYIETIWDPGDGPERDRKVAEWRTFPHLRVIQIVDHGRVSKTYKPRPGR